MPSRWLIAALLTTGLLAALHFYALEHFLYWRYRWFDTPMHMLGGAAIGVFAVALLKRYRPFVYLGIIIAAAVAWEVYEYYFGLAVLPGTNYAWDTAHDILNDALGAVLVYVIARLTIWKPAA
jgi:hypothetical protein